MKKIFPSPWRPIEIAAAALTLGILVLYTHALLFTAPYPGFYMEPQTGKVVYIFEDQSGTGSLKIHDVVTRIGSTDYAEYRKDKSLVLFADAQAGQVVELEIERGGETLTVPWIYTGFTSSEFWNRVINNWLLGYFFWFFGTATLLFVRPRDEKWTLLTAVNYLTGLFIVAGSMSATHVLYSLYLMRFIAWLMAPVYIHFHWIFPSPLRRVPKWVGRGLYIFSLGMAVLSVFPSTPSGLFYIGLLLAFGVSLAIFLSRGIRKTAQAREVRRLGILVTIAFLPILIIGLVGREEPLVYLAPLTLFFLLLLPAAYFYWVFRTRLGGMEVRSNRAVSLYIYLVILSSALLLAAALIVQTKTLPVGSDILFFNSLLAVFLVALFSIFAFPHFASQVERRFLGIKLPHTNLPEIFSARIATSNSMEGLMGILTEEVYPSMFVRQYAFLSCSDGQAGVVAAKEAGDPEVLIKAAADIPLASWTESRILPTGGPPPLEWVRASLPLKVGDTLLGLWLLGRRDPDDLYLQAEMPIIQSLASQTAIAMSNIQKTAQIKAIYQANVDRYEQERLRLALELHDSVLNELATLLMFLDPSAQTPKFQAGYDSLTHRLREIVAELRPPMLNYGFNFGLAELADHLSEIHNDLVQIEVTVQGEDDLHYPQNVEHHIYRMVQEACENSIRHGQAGRVHILGRMDETSIDLTIEDDGRGFNAESTTQPQHLVSQKHFGLAGMKERADLIGAEVRFNSMPQKGTQVTIHWKASQ